MKERTAKVQRKTRETEVEIYMNLDGKGEYEIDTGIGFLDHMLTHLSKHSRIDLKIKAKGDLEVDAHHTVEDISISLGQGLLEALGSKKGINRYGSSSVPMEETIANVSVDLSGRPHFVYNVRFQTERIGDFEVECIEEMLRAFSSSGRFNLHINVPYGTNSHHMAEAIFKGLAQSLGTAVEVNRDDIPSTKGVL